MYGKFLAMYSKSCCLLVVSIVAPDIECFTRHGISIFLFHALGNTPSNGNIVFSNRGDFPRAGCVIHSVNDGDYQRALGLRRSSVVQTYLGLIGKF